MKIQFKPEFEKQLRKRHIRCRFIQNLKMLYPKEQLDFVIDDLNKEKYFYKFIDNAFTWDETKEKGAFWARIYDDARNEEND